MPSRFKSTSRLVIGVLLTLLPCSGSAEPILFVRVQASGDGSTPGRSPEGGFSNSTGAALHTIGDVRGHTATASARADYGRLGAYARVSTRALCTPVEYDRCEREGISANAESSWTDDFTIVSDYLPPGTAVAFDYSLGFDGPVTRSSTYERGSVGPPSRFGASAIVTLRGVPDVPLGSVSLLQVTMLLDGRITTDAGTYVGVQLTDREADDSLVGVMMLTVGQTYSFSQRLTASAFTDAIGSAFAEADLFETAIFRLSARESSYGYVTSSGTDYSEARDVPEASSVLILGVGVLGTLVRRRTLV